MAESDHPLSPEALRILKALEGIRKNLLDLTLRNKLLNYRPSKVRGVAVVGEDSSQVFRRLAIENRAMAFTGIPERKKTGDVEPAPTASTVDTSDDKLNTTYEVTALQDRLLRTWNDANTIIEEQGINTLFLAVGMVEWIEEPTSERILKAPVLLLPVVLERGEKGRFRLRWTGEDLGPNRSLAVKFKEEFEIKWPEIGDGDDFDLSTYFDAVELAIRGRSGFRLQRDSVVIDFFSFAKYLMFEDLDPSRWPDGNRPHQHEIVSALLGEGVVREGPPSPDPDPLDAHRHPGSAFEVCDADSSQTLVLMDVSSGKNMVVEGPPGTGKSQTIANIIADVVANGKTALFVAEKMAALEVVKRRLDEYGIGDACLELHSHKARKREFLQEMGRAFGLERIGIQGAAQHIDRLMEARAKLSNYASELHRPIEPSGWTPFEAHGELARIGLLKEQPARGSVEELNTLTRDAFEQRRRAIRDLNAKIDEIGTPAKHPFFDCHPVDFLPGDVPALSAELASGRDCVIHLRVKSEELSTLLSADPPATVRDASGLALAAELVLVSPSMAWEIEAADPRWGGDAPTILGALSAGVSRLGLRGQFGGVLRDDAWGQDVEQLSEDLDRSGPGLGRFFTPSFYRARRRLEDLCRGEIPRRFEARQGLVQAIREESTCSKQVEASATLLAGVCGKSWKEFGSDFAALLKAGEWTAGLHRLIAEGEIPRSVLRVFLGGQPTGPLQEAATTVRACVSAVEQAIAPISIRLRPNPTMWCGNESSDHPSLTKSEIAKLEQWLTLASGEPSRVLEIIAYNRLRNVSQELGLPSFCKIADHWEASHPRLEDSLLLVWCEIVVRAATQERPNLATFDRVSHDNLLEEYRRLDRQMITLNRERVRAVHRSHLPPATGAGSTGVLREQINLARRQRPIRRLMQECTGPIQKLKPVFMMSPFSVAMFLPPDGPQFDVVIFDEASQVRPEDAVGALLRARQAVVVGDSHQLPPTSFFEHTLVDDDETDEDAGTLPHVAAGTMESILSLMRARGADVRDLHWHYRSRHASLIRVSGHAFYPRLEIFPSPEETASNTGLRLHHLPDTVYGRGESKTNLEEAKAVVRAVRDHAEQSPGLTLGVAAFSVSQQMAILRQLELSRREDPVLEAFISRHHHEPFFIKNLENVQGDERDVVFISVGYGRDAERRLTLNFGPLNQDGGERRLNVLISRARQRCEIFTNFTSDDLGLPANAPKGVRLLKTYLKFAESGSLDVPGETGKEADSPFEEAVAAMLRREGHVVGHQVGSAGFFIDLAVIDMERPGRYLLGIECDGAKYHSARSARDRDRLREQILRSKGWLIHRIWSTAWYHQHDIERRRLLSAIEAARTTSQAPPSPLESSSGPEEDPPTVQVDTANTATPALTVKYQVADLRLNLRGKDLHEIWVGTLAEAVKKVVAVESPVHIEEVIRRVREAAGIQKAGGRIRRMFGQVFGHAASQSWIVSNGDFLWSPEMREPIPRDRSELVDGARSLRFVAPEEIRQLMLAVVRGAFRISPDELASEVVRQLGFGRLTGEMRTRLQKELESAVSAGRLSLNAGVVQEPEQS